MSLAPAVALAGVAGNESLTLLPVFARASIAGLTPEACLRRAVRAKKRLTW